MSGTPLKPSSFPSVDDVQNTVALSSDPILRNLEITQGYCELSKAMTLMTCGGNVSWCGFASWSSKIIGVALRDANANQRGVKAITESPIYRETVQRMLNLLQGAGLSVDSPFDNVLEQALIEAIDNLKQGNVEVYGEIGVLYSRLVSALGNDDNLDLTRLAPVIAPFDSRPSEQGGQSLLRGAAENYYRARFEVNEGRKAQQVLLANAQIGKHEQMRLQPRIDEFLGASIEQRIVEYWNQQCARNEVIQDAMSPLARGVGSLARDAWSKFATDLVLHLDLPGNEQLWLSRDVPAPKGKPLFPLELQNITSQDARTILQEFGADGATAAGTGARDWSDLGQRMHYILVLFRSRQLESILLSETFSASQKTDIKAGRMPVPPPPL